MLCMAYSCQSVSMKSSIANTRKTGLLSVSTAYGRLCMTHPCLFEQPYPIKGFFEVPIQ